MTRPRVLLNLDQQPPDKEHLLMPETMQNDNFEEYSSQ